MEELLRYPCPECGKVLRQEPRFGLFFCDDCNKSWSPFHLEPLAQPPH